MKKLIFLLVMMAGLFGYGQDRVTKTDILSFEGQFTTTERDLLDVPAGEVWIIYNSTAGQFQYSGDPESWQALGGGAADNLGADVSRGLFTVSGTGTLATINNDVVGSANVINNSLTADDLATNSVGTDEIVNGSISGADIASNAINSGNIQDDSVRPVDLESTNAGTTGQVPSIAATGEFTWVNNAAGVDELVDLSDVSTSTQGTSNVLISNGTTFASRQIVEADIADLAHIANTDNQNASQVAITDTGGYYTATDVEGALQEIGSGGGAGSDDQNLTGATLNGSNILQIDIEAGLSTTVDLSSLDDTGTDDQTAAEVTYSNATSGLTATDVQAAIDEVAGANDNQTLTLLSDILYIERGNNQSLVPYRQQVDTLQLTGTTLEMSLSEDNVSLKTVDLASLQDGTGTDDQTAAEVSVAATPVNYTAGTADVEAHLAGIDTALGTVSGESTTVSDTPEIDLTLTGVDITADIVTGSIDETKLDVSTNASLDLADSALQAEVDGSTTNELQDLTLATNTLSITQDPTPGAEIDLSPYLDNTDAQDLTLTGNTLAVTGDPNTDVDLSGYLDNTDAQTLSFTDPNLSISGGNSVDLSALKDGTGTDDQTAAEVSYSNATSGLTATDVQAAIDEVDGTVDGKADLVSETGWSGSHDWTGANTIFDQFSLETTVTAPGATLNRVYLDITSGGDFGIQEYNTNNYGYFDLSPLTAIRTWTFPDSNGTIALTTDITDDQTAAEVGYTNTTSGLTATDVQAAIDEVEARVDVNDAKVSGVTDHGALTGLGDDDHGIYLLNNANDITTGDLEIRGGTLAVGSTTQAAKYTHHKGDTGIMDLEFENDYLRWRRGGGGTIDGWRWDSFDIDAMRLTTGGDLFLENGTLSIGSDSAEGLKLLGTGVGTANTSYLGLYESNGTTRQGYVGFSSGTQNHMYFNNEASGQYLYLDGAGGNTALKFHNGTGAYTVWSSINDGSGSGLSADDLDGKELSSASDRYDVIPITASDGRTEIGFDLDFHQSDASVVDYEHRLTSTGTTMRVQSNEATTVVEAYESSNDYARLGANASGGYLQLGDGAGGNTTLRGYSAWDVYERVQLRSQAEPLRIVGTGTGTGNQGYLTMYESNNTTRQGYVGFPSATNSNMYMLNDVPSGNTYVMLSGSGGSNGLKYYDGTTEETVYHSGNGPTKTDFASSVALVGATTGTYSVTTKECWYVEFGDMVIFTIGLYTVSGTTPTGVLRVTGLPFAAEGRTEYPVLIDFGSSGSPSYYSTIAHQYSGATYIEFSYQAALDADASTLISNADFGTGGALMVSGSYIKD